MSIDTALEYGEPQAAEQQEGASSQADLNHLTVCVKARFRNEQKRLLLPHDEDWCTVRQTIESSFDTGFHRITLQSCHGEDGYYWAGDEAIDNNVRWKAAVEDHTGGKWNWDAETETWMRTVLLECHQDCAEELPKPLDVMAVLGSGDDVDAAVAEWLTAGGAINAVDFDSRSALITAIICGSETLAAALIRHGIDVELESKDGFRAVHHAAMGDEPEILALLLGLGANVNATFLLHVYPSLRSQQRRFAHDW